MNKKSLLSFVLGIVFSTHLSAQEKASPTILSIAGENISKAEFERVFKKNNNKETTFDKKSVNDYLNLYINYKLKVKESIQLGMDTAKSFVDELSGYRKQLAQPYLVDKEVTEFLLKEAYNRMKTDVRASHILIKVSPDALPKDTLEAYNKAVKIRTEILKGADFTAIAKVKSDDPSAKENGGDLGFFTALQMVYQFESAAYNLKTDELSMPVRTRFGYHIIKVTESRAAQGEVKVAHIMVKSAAGIKESDSLTAVQKINEIYAKLKAGENFEDLAKKFSDDQGSAKNGGALPMFGTGRMVPEFEKAAFSLKNIGDLSQPVKSSYGWHIIKLLEKKPLGTYEELQADLKSKVGKDSRSELSKSSMINRIKQKYSFKEMPKAKEEFMKEVDSSLTQGKWTAEKTASLKKVMFTLSNNSYTQQDFSKFLEDHQSHKSGSSPKAVANNSYNDWVNENCISYEEKHLDSLYVDFRNLMQEYRDGILLFELTDKKVWSKAVKDSAGLKEFYDKNKNNYKWGDRLEATVYTCADAEISKEVRKQMKKVDDVDTLLSLINKSSKLNLQVKSSKFSKGDNEIIDSIPWVAGITKDLKKNGQVVFVDVKKVLPSQPKSLEEAKGLVTADYQSFLEKEWIESLRQKYPVKIYQEVVDTVSK
jgi:peptidyl-prolyl cis-trans isomerase SurA